MTALRLMLAEIGYRRVNFLLCVLAVLVAATLFVAGPTLISAYSDQTTQLVNNHMQETTHLVAEQQKETREKLAEMRVTLAENLAAKEAELDGDLTELVAQNEEHLEQMRRNLDEDLTALEKDTRKTMLKLGFNLNIVHKDTNMSSLYIDYNVVDMPEEYIHTLAAAEEIDMIRHLFASIQDKIKWEGRTVRLLGMLPEVHQSHMSEKPDMVAAIKQGTVLVGSELAASVTGSDGPLKVGDTITISNADVELQFEVAEIMPEKTSLDDVTLAVHLHDAQKLLGKPGRVTQIQALGCHCDEANLPNIRSKLSTVLPDTQVTEYLSNRLTRAEQRDSVANTRAKLIAKEQSMRQMAVSQMKRSHQRILLSTESKHEEELLAAEADGATILAGIQTSRDSELKSQKTARDGVRQTLSQLMAVTTPLVVIVAAAFVCLMLWNNVRERRQEIAVLRAIGKGVGTVASLVLGRALVLGIIGGALGCLLGYSTARIVGQLLGISDASYVFSTLR